MAIDYENFDGVRQYLLEILSDSEVDLNVLELVDPQSILVRVDTKVQQNMRAALQAKAPVVAEPKSAAPAVQEINVEEESEPSPRSMRSRVAGAGRVLYNLPGGVAGAVAQSPRQVGRLANRGRQEVSERTQKATNAVREGLAQLGRRSLSPRNWVRPAASILPNNGSPQRVVRGGEGRAASAPR